MEYCILIEPILVKNFIRTLMIEKLGNIFMMCVIVNLFYFSVDEDYEHL